MLKKGFEDHLMLLSTLAVLMIVRIPTLAALGTLSKRSATPSVWDTVTDAEWDFVKDAEEGNLEKVKVAVVKGVNINWNKGTALNKASYNGHIEVVRYLLEAGANPNGWNGPDRGIISGKALVSAARNNNLEIVNLLIDAGATLTPTTDDELSALEESAERGYLEVVQRLTEAGADIHYDTDTALRVAAWKGHLDVVNHLLKAGGNVTVVDWAIESAATGGHLEVVKVLIEGGIIDGGLGMALFHAASNGHLDIVIFLLQKGADPNYRGTLWKAAYYGNLEMVRVLLESGANSTCTEEGRDCPTHAAAGEGHMDIVALLVEYGADINTSMKGDYLRTGGDRYGDGWSVMHLAALYGFVMTQELLDLGADINFRNAKGRTPLHIAVEAEKLMTAKKLLRFCADVNIADDEGRTPLDMARDVALRNTSERAAYEVLMTALLQVLPEKIASSPNNKEAELHLAKEFMAIVEANSTLKEQLESYAHLALVKSSLRQIFAEQARNGMAQIIEDHSCGSPLQEEFNIAVGTEYLVKCGCLPGQGPTMTFTLRQEEDQCAPVSVVKKEEDEVEEDDDEEDDDDAEDDEEEVPPEFAESETATEIPTEV